MCFLLRPPYRADELICLVYGQTNSTSSLEVEQRATGISVTAIDRLVMIAIQREVSATRQRTQMSPFAWLTARESSSRLKEGSFGRHQDRAAAKRTGNCFDDVTVLTRFDRLYNHESIVYKSRTRVSRLRVVDSQWDYK
jgi:hypothetical protein